MKDILENFRLSYKLYLNTICAFTMSVQDVFLYLGKITQSGTGLTTFLLNVNR